MPILGAQSLRRSYGEREVLRDVSLTIDAGDRIGLVGNNGCGKSTLARILAGLEQPDGGLVTVGRDIRCVYLEQDPAMAAEARPVDIALSGLRAWTEAMARYEEINQRLSAPGADHEGLLAEQAAAAAELERLGGWDLRHQAEAMLGHLGVGDIERPVGTMSGGERRRVALARLLVSQPEVAILDEPTNHLDIPTIEWLERFLVERFRGALLLITHDRYLLDRVVRRTLEIESGELHSYDGGWEAYLTGRAERQAQAERVEANRRNFLRRELEWLRRQPKARTGKQKARIDRAHAVIDREGPNQQGTATLAIAGTRSGKTVLDASDIAVDMAGTRLVDGLTLSLTKGQRVGIVGPNGAGKTTLLRALLGEHPLAAGTVTLGKNTRVAYLDQSRAGLDDGETIFENVAMGREQLVLGEQGLDVRTYLQRFLFDRQDQSQKVGTLSGGERARVALAKVLSDTANLVVLDEPTNDLDVYTLAALESSLLDFCGTVLIVTHDRWFLDRVATSILGFRGDGVVTHVAGNYADYAGWVADQERQEAAARAAQQPAASARTAAPPPAKPERPRKLSFNERRELEGMMERIDAAEAAVAELEAGLTQPTFTELDYKAQQAYLAELEAAKQHAEQLVERWSELEALAEGDTGR